VTKLGDYPSVVQGSLAILSDMCAIHDEHWEPRVRLALEFFLRATQEGCDIPATVEGFVLPLLRIITTLSTPQPGAPSQVCAVCLLECTFPNRPWLCVASVAHKLRVDYCFALAVAHAFICAAGMYAWTQAHAAEE
jgi:hypothetical protein